MIRATRLTKVIEGATILEDVSLNVERGEALHIVGSPKSGRTTLLRILATLVPPTSGTVSIDGVDAARHSFHARRHVTYVSPDMVVGSCLSVEEYLWTVARAWRISPAPRVSELTTRAGLSRHAAVDRLGTGERTALALTAALLTQSAVLLLDDALPGVEGRVRTQLTGSIREAIENGAALIAASDGRADELTELCGHIATLRGGRLYADFLIRTPAEHV